MKATAKVEIHQNYTASVNGHRTTVTILHASKRGGWTAVDHGTGKPVHITAQMLRAKAEAKAATV